MRYLPQKLISFYSLIVPIDSTQRVSAHLKNTPWHLRAKGDRLRQQRWQALEVPLQIKGHGIGIDTRLAVVSEFVAPILITDAHP